MIAVSLEMSDEPLFLLKTPIGTGAIEASYIARTDHVAIILSSNPIFSDLWKYP